MPDLSIKSLGLRGISCLLYPWYLLCLTIKARSQRLGIWEYFLLSLRSLSLERPFEEVQKGAQEKVRLWVQL